MMVDSQNTFVQLRNILAELYPDVASVRRIGDDAGIDLGQINFQTGAINFWHAILAEALRAGKGDVLLNVVLSEYPAHSKLRKAYNAYIGAGKRLIPSPPPGAGKEEQRAYQNRQAMLKLVYDIWVKGVLEKSLYNQLLIDLDMEQRPEAVERPWGMVLETPAQDSRVLPANTKITTVFAELNQSMLILGEPGSGKSTMLLELARDLLTQATQNPALPMPVLFNLSSWVDKRQPIHQWLVDELREKYQIPKALAQAWVEHDELLLLLDGLDEVRKNYREDCIKALNEFQQSRKQTVPPLALCSRMAEYTELTSKLKLNGAIVLHPLTLRQIDMFLLLAGDNLSAVAHLIQSNTEILTLAQSPLTFSILCLTYHSQALADLEIVSATGTPLQHLFNSYIVQMFQHRSKFITDRYSRAQTLGWLTWVAAKMVRHSQTLFLIERLQPDWLQPQQHLLYSLVFGIIGVLIFTPLLGWYTNLLLGLVSLLIGLLGGINPTERLVFTWRIDKKSIHKWLNFRIKGIPLFWVMLGLLCGKSLPWSHDNLHLLLDLCLFIGLLFWISVIMLGGYGVDGLLSTLIKQAETNQRIRPNQGMWNSARNMWIGAFVIGVVAGLTYGLVAVLSFGLPILLIAGVLVGLLFGLGSGMKYGGLACIKHLVLRSFLYLYSYAPLNYARFLDYCADRLFLRKVGGGYIFVHRLLMEHFASLTEEDIKRLAAASDRR